MGKHLQKTYTTDYYITLRKQISTYISALETLTLNATSADAWKITFTYSYNVLE